MSFDLQSVPFSTYGSYLAVSHMQARDGQPSGLYLRSCHKQSGTTRCLRLALVVDGAEVEFTSAAEPDCLHLQCPAGWVDLVFDDARTLRARGEGVSLRLGQDQCASGDAALPRRAEQWQVRLFSRNFNAMLIPLHGQLEVEAPWQMDHSTSIRIEARQQGEQARLEVRDGGLGIPPEDRERIFKRFERAVSPRHFGGLGLGLWITHQSVAALGGSIEVQSEPGVSSTFVVTLPCGG
ncbi:MAG: sensor histidine kinase, partial [Planctomycetota bacterium]